MIGSEGQAAVVTHHQGCGGGAAAARTGKAEPCRNCGKCKVSAALLAAAEALQGRNATMLAGGSLQAE